MKRLDQSGLWQERVKAFEQSELPVEAFCKAEGCSKTMLYKWRHRLRSSQAPAKVEFVELGAAAKPHGIELLMKSGIVVRLGADFDEARLKRLLDMLDAR